MAGDETTTAAGTADLVVKRVFDAPVDQVWRAWSDPEYVKQWWGPHGFTAPVAEMDFREGGTSLVCMSSPEYGDQYSTWHYRRIAPLSHIEYVHHLADEAGAAADPTDLGMPADFPQGQRHLVTFTSLDDGRTELTVTEYEWSVGQMMEYSKIGLEQCLDKMAAILSRPRPESASQK